MGLLKGGLSLRRFLVLGPVPNEKDLVSGLTQDQFRTFQDGLEEQRHGWCDWRNLKYTPDKRWVTMDRFAVFGLRIDVRKIPAALLQATLDERLDQLKTEKDLAFIGKDARVSLQDEIKVELLKKVLPTPKVFDVAWDLKGGIVWTTATGTSTQSALVGLFVKSFGLELHHMVPLLLAGRLCPEIPTEALMALDPLDLETQFTGKASHDQ